jgi:FkbM family methyltransferase
LSPSVFRDWGNFSRLGNYDNLRRLGWHTYIPQTLGGFAARRHILIVGGYLGDSAEIWSGYSPKALHIFEPVPMFYEKIRERFIDRPEFITYQLALGHENGQINLRTEGDATGKWASGVALMAKQISLDEWLDRNEMELGLTEINIEGGEYELLEGLSIEGLRRLGAIALQFHFSENSFEIRRKMLREKLNFTHVQIFNLDLVWELWVPRAVA